MERRAFLKEKITNFVSFIKETFGPENILIKEFGEMVDVDKNGYEPFLKGLLTICEYLQLPMETEEQKKNNMGRLDLYLAWKGLSCDFAAKEKLLRYFDLFFKTF